MPTAEGIQAMMRRQIDQAEAHVRDLRHQYIAANNSNNAMYLLTQNAVSALTADNVPAEMRIVEALKILREVSRYV